MESSLVDAWPHIPPADRPAPLIRAINDRLTTPDRVAAALAVTPMLVGRTELRALLDRLAAGCLSHLEIWGHDHVFTAPGMPPFLRQFRVQIGGRVLYLDMYAERQLATLGILVVRFSHRRLTHEPDEVRRETLAILARRREQPASPRER
ncbi:hypothetical protein ACFQ0D_21135 [Micromonospora zhanjiangensis]